MMINADERFMSSSVLNISRANYSHEKKIQNDVISNPLHRVSSFNGVQRTIFILSMVVLFWILFVVIYLTSHLIIRIISNSKRLHYDSSLSSNAKVCQAFVVSSNEYGSFRPIQSLYRSDSLFSSHNFSLTNEQITTISNYEIVNPKINQRSNITDISQYQQSKTSLLEHYLKTYNPLEIDLTNTNNETNVKITSYDDVPSETDTRPIDNCYPLSCTNKRSLHHAGRYARLKELENCSATMSIADDRLSECSTKLTSTTLPVVMITDCSDSQRLHTDIIEMNEDE